MEKKRKYTSSQFRFERKFFITQLSSLDIEYIIKVNPAIFSEIFNKRNVNNIYFDTLNLDNYLENIEGEKNRKKIRIRWYGDLFGYIKYPVLELKVRNGQLGKKLSYPLKSFSLNHDEDFTKLLNKECLENPLVDLKSLKPTLLNRYSRKYFLSSDKKFRITLDDKQLFYGLYGQNFLKNKSLDRDSVILELKYGEEEDNNSSKITNSFPFRLTKSSKYVSGIQKTSKTFHS